MSLVLALAAGCIAPRSSSNEMEAAEQELLGGFTGGRVRALDAVGSIVEVINTAGGGRIENKCTGALIGPHTVLTAAQCVQKYRGKNSIAYTEMYFRLGFDAANPVRTVRIVGGEIGPISSGGQLGRGADVGFFQLEEDVTEIDALPFSDVALTRAEYGDQFLIAGYGQHTVSDPVGRHRTRALGRVRLAALEGNALTSVWPTIEALAHWLVRNVNPAVTVEALRPFWNASHEVLPGYTAFFTSVGGSQGALGDAGAPILRFRDGRLEIVAVFGSHYTLGGRPWGGGHAGLVAPSEHQAFLAAALASRCRSVPEAGMCNGDTAIQCNAATEWAPPISSIDCAEFGLRCGVESDGTSTCVDAAEPAAAPTACSLQATFRHPNGSAYEFRADGIYAIRGTARGTWTFTDGILRLDDSGGPCLGSTGTYRLDFNADCSVFTVNLQHDGCRLRGESFDLTPLTRI